MKSMKFTYHKNFWVYGIHALCNILAAVVGIVVIIVFLAIATKNEIDSSKLYYHLDVLLLTNWF